MCAPGGCENFGGHLGATTHHLMKGKPLPYKPFTRALLVAGAVAAPLAPIAPAAAQAPAPFVVCLVATIGPSKIGAEATAPIKYGFTVHCVDLETSAPASPDTRHIGVQLQQVAGDDTSYPSIVDRFDDYSIDANIEVTHLYACFGGPSARYRVHWEGVATKAGVADPNSGDGDWVSLAC